MLPYLALTGIAMVLLVVSWCTPVRAELHEGYSLAHHPVTTERLPDPERMITLSLTLEGTKDVTKDITAMIVRDARRMELVPHRVTLDVYDNAVYEFRLYAPLAELEYSFVVQEDGGKFQRSKVYRVTRACLPDTAPVDTAIDPMLVGTERVDALATVAAKLEHEINQYQEVRKLLEKLEEHLK